MQSLFRTANFRVNPQYEVVPHGRLTAGDLEWAPEYTPEEYGVLRPRPDSPLPPIAIDRETALLLLTLREAGPLPEYVIRTLESGAERTIQQMLFDQILEVEGPDGYISGPTTGAVLKFDKPLGDGLLASLSADALRYGQSLQLTDPIALSLKLYRYNQRPASPYWRRKLPNRAATMEFLGIAPDGPLERSLTKSWQLLDADTTGWAHFTARAPRMVPTSTPCKLYISPTPEALPEALAIAIECFTKAGTQQFKVGSDMHGVLRPDKLVAYFSSKEHLLDALEVVRPRCEGMPVQGVPFTADADAGLLSWGADPRPSGAEPTGSWRQWVTNRLATTMVAAHDDTGGIEPWRYALERLRLDGIDLQTFSPTGRWTG